MVATVLYGIKQDVLEMGSNVCFKLAYFHLWKVWDNNAEGKGEIQCDKPLCHSVISSGRY
jgi:hypothetical protein